MNRAVLKADDFWQVHDRRLRRLGQLCALALLAAANLAIYLFCDRHIEGLRQWVVELPLHLLTLMAAQHILFSAQSYSR